MIVSIDDAAKIILSGGIVAIPTETVYGLAADAFLLDAVKKTFQAKERPADNPLIVHISDEDHLDLLTTGFPDDAKKLADEFWPGPITFVLNKKKRVPDIITAGLDTVAVRMPAHPMALELIHKTGPLTAPSANKSGRPSPTRLSHVAEDFGESLPVIDGGTATIGLESTVIDLTGTAPVLLRHGAISSEMIEQILAKEIITLSSGNSLKKSPGTRHSHYKPKAAVAWMPPGTSPVNRKHYYLFHSAAGQKNSPNTHFYDGDLHTFAKDLFDHFRTADHLGYSKIMIEPFLQDQQHPLLDALKDRIERASGR